MELGIAVLPRHQLIVFGPDVVFELRRGNVDIA
jgi:hypothetical protein